MLYDTKKQKYAKVSLVKGGGTRKVDLPLEFNREDVIRYAVKLFYPDDEYTSGVTYDLANFKQEPVSHLVDCNGKEHDFTIQKYCEVSKTHQFNLYLLVKETDKEPDKDEEEEEEDDSELYNPVFSPQIDSPIPEKEEAYEGDINDLQVVNLLRDEGSARKKTETQDRTASCTSTTTRVGNESLSNWNLIGSNSDRLHLLKEQQSAYEESLKADQEKEVNKMEEVQRQQSLESLTCARLSRVTPEPHETSKSQNLRISIRHPTLGAVSRSFLRGGSMLAVYDWCGSLSLEPEFFGLYTALPRRFISPCEAVTSVEGTMLYVEEQTCPVSLSNDELEVSLRGFGLAPQNTAFIEEYNTIQLEDNAHLAVGSLLDDQSR